MNLLAVLESIQGQRLNLRPAGFFNVEGGDAALATDYFDWCDSCLDQLGPATVDCADCGRGVGKFIRLPAGDGDGVYVAFELFDRAHPNQAIGALVVFDNNYEIADAVRDPILEEQVPEAPLPLLKKHGHAALRDLGDFGPSRKALISDGLAGVDSKFATVDIDFGSENRLRAYAFVESISSDIREEVNRLARDAGMDRESVLGMLESLVETARVMEDMPKGYGTLPEVFFRGVLLITEDWGAKLDLVSEDLYLDWEELTGQYLGKICTSHQQPMEAAAVWFNVLLQREFDRAAGNVPVDRAKTLLFNMWTWVYQGLHNLDDDCRPLVDNAYKPTRDEVVDLLLRRGLKEAAQLFLDAGRIGEVPIPVAEESQASERPNFPEAKETATVAGSALAKFCGECGTRFEIDEAKFCSECGSRR